jgi:DNA invertase Pin-like site-specific DNA recombinase
MLRGVAYYRVSTDKQGRSGLGLDAQREAVRKTMGDGYPPVAEFTEVESGKRSDRPELTKALAMAKVMQLPLVVAKVDRLARNVAFLETIHASDVEVVFCDLPQVQGATGQFIVQQMALVAQLEAGLISERTKAALKAVKDRGVTLGGFRGYIPDPSTAAAAKASAANGRASCLAPIIADIRTAGATSLRQIADALNARGIPTPRGSTWRAVQVKRVIERTSLGG